jgi:hypothetical protein
MFASLDGSTTISASSSPPSPDQLIFSSTPPTTNFNGPVTPGSGGGGGGSGTMTSSIGNSEDDSLAMNSAGSCSRLAARSYGFADCSEVYLAGKRTSGIYEIW